MDNLRTVCDDILREARRRGADQADVVISESTSNKIRVRLGEIEELKQTNPKSLGIRVFKNKQKALTYTSDLRRDSLRRLVRETVEMAAYSAADEFNGLAEPALQGQAAARLDLYDPAVETLATDRKIAIIRELEKLGMAQDTRITNSSGATWNDSRQRWVIADTNGFYGETQNSFFSLTLSLMAEEKGVKQTDYWWSQKHHFDRLEAIDSIARQAAIRTLAKLGGRKPKTQTIPVVFDPLVGSDFLNIIASVVLGTAIYRKNSFLLDKLNQPIAVEDLTIIDDGLLPDGLGSNLFDDEGLPCRRNTIIENGVLKTYLCDIYASRKLKLPPTGSASRGVTSNPAPATTNLFMQNGPYSRDEIIASVKKGLYLTSVDWTGINYVTGDYSRGASGTWIENGRLTYPVQEFTVAGNMPEMMQQIVMIGDDLVMRSTSEAPTFKIKSMTISGT